MQLREKLSTWDGKSTAYLNDIYNVECSGSEFIDPLLELLDDDAVQSATSWLLKHASENGVSFKEGQVYELYDKVDILTTWQYI